MPLARAGGEYEMGTGPPLVREVRDPPPPPPPPNILHGNGSFFYIFTRHFPPEFIAKECMYCISTLLLNSVEGSTSLLNSVVLTIIPSNK